MAKSDAVWGIDIGNCSLKAIRCRPGAESGKITADAFDFIEYPKILTQPGAEPEELVREAIEQFLSRNTVRGDRVAISVSGQNGLARFIKLPPVEAKKIPDIVRYEAKQQIPFDLADVVWDYQRIGATSDEEGFALDTEIGLFAMKRDQVFRALQPFEAAGIEVDFIQLTPLALYNYIAFDQLKDLPSADEYDPDSPPPSVVVLSLGTDATDLVVTNGFRVWQRSIPIGGSHFTKALTKELKLTFAKAEHLKRNAGQAQDPKAVFQAMRPVFNDLLTEIQRSIGYFTSLDRNAEISHVVALGNAMKLPGLRRYLAQSLGYDVVRLESFEGLEGPEVVNAPAFQDNQLCFGVSYGLTLQGLGQGGIRTNLIPDEIKKSRAIRAKKPWAIAAAATLLLGLTCSFVSSSIALETVGVDFFREAESDANSVQTLSDGLNTRRTEAIAQLNKIDTIGENLTGGIEGRIIWLELLRAVNACLPIDDPTVRRNGDPVAEGEEKPINERNELHITNIETQKVMDVGVWWDHVARTDWYMPSEDDEIDEDSEEEGKVRGPEGEGWIVSITGHHFHNFATSEELGDGVDTGPQYIRDTLIKNLQSQVITLPTSASKKRSTLITNPPNGIEFEEVSMKEMGISFPVLLTPTNPKWKIETDPAYEILLKKEEWRKRLTEGSSTGGYEDEGADEMMEEGESGGGETNSGAAWLKDKAALDELRRHQKEVGQCDFVVQFVWTKMSPSKRDQARAQALLDAENEEEYGEE